MTAVGVAGPGRYDRQRVAQANRLAVLAALKTAVDVVSISASTVDSDLARIAASATGSFKHEFTQGAPGVRKAVVGNNIEARSLVRRAGLVSGDLDSAIVLVSVDATVANVRRPHGRASRHQFQMKLARDSSSGRWLVSQLDFVG